MSTLSRRDFLKLSALALGNMAFSPAKERLNLFDDRMLVRVGTTEISVHSMPSDDARITGQWYRDDLLTVYETVTAKTPEYNPIWYRVWGGYVHRARLQPVQILYNPFQTKFEEGKRYLAEVTIPYTRAMKYSTFYGWEDRYRLYYGSTHWVEKLEEGPDGEPWYLIYDELTSERYHAKAEALRIIPDEEVAPISPEVEFQDKYVDVDLTTQTIKAYEKGVVVFSTTISSGLNMRVGGSNLRTPTGTFNIMEKKPSKHMGDGSLASDIEAYELPGVPWTCFFTNKGHAFHGTYWHDNFGVPMSHGCLNMRNDEAKWLYRWLTPVNKGAEYFSRGYGTTINIFYS